MNLTTDEIKQTSYILRLTNPSYNKGDICKILKLNVDDRNETHSCALGIWKANQKLGTKKGYAI